MDLNALYFYRQIAMMKGPRALSQGDEQSFFDLNAHYEKRIVEERTRLGYSGDCSPTTPHGSPVLTGASMALVA